jgi:exo-beta-1,3-glucanase (GH17 family)
VSTIDKNRFSVLSRSSALQAGRMDNFDLPLSSANLGLNFSKMNHADKVSLVRQILEQKMYGISFSPYVDGQSPGTDIREEQIRQRLSIIQPFTRWIRNFSCIEGNQETPRIAVESGLKTMVGIGLSEDKEANEIEITNGIKVAKQGYASILAVGNEVLLRGDLSENELIAYIKRVKEELPNVQVGYVDAYFLFENHPGVAEACDVILVNCYPFWESCEKQYALAHMKEMYSRALKVASGKKVIISETGWPSVGEPYGDAVPSHNNAMEYFIDASYWANEEGIEMFYFSSFDESWKVVDEGDVGAYWGLWDKDGNLKYV